ncbi:MAG: OadG family protein [Clostridiales bacterium]|nr:OadG family protein [Clostridiales bacterium]
MNRLMLDTIKLMSIGMSTVFSVLLVFYFMVRLLIKVFPAGEDK